MSVTCSLVIFLRASFAFYRHVLRNMGQGMGIWILGGLMLIFCFYFFNSHFTISSSILFYLLRQTILSLSLLKLYFSLFVFFFSLQYGKEEKRKIYKTRESFIFSSRPFFLSLSCSSIFPYPSLFFFTIWKRGKVKNL